MSDSILNDKNNLAEGQKDKGVIVTILVDVSDHVRDHVKEIEEEVNNLLSILHTCMPLGRVKVDILQCNDRVWMINDSEPIEKVGRYRLSYQGGKCNLCSAV